MAPQCSRFKTYTFHKSFHNTPVTRTSLDCLRGILFFFRIFNSLFSLSLHFTRCIVSASYVSVSFRAYVCYLHVVSCRVVSLLDTDAMKPAAVSIIAAAIMTTVTLPLTNQYDVIWSTTIRRYEVDLRTLQYTKATGSDVTTVNDVTVPTRAVRATPHPYDPTLGWYTAAVISALILAFLFCAGMKKAKRAIIDYWEAR